MNDKIKFIFFVFKKAPKYSRALSQIIFIDFRNSYSESKSQQ